MPTVKGLEIKILNTAANDNPVFNEGVDISEIKKIKLPVADVFEVSGGKIAKWRDYFDLAMATKQLSLIFKTRGEAQTHCPVFLGEVQGQSA